MRRKMNSEKKRHYRAELGEWLQAFALGSLVNGAFWYAALDENHVPGLSMVVVAGALGTIGVILAAHNMDPVDTDFDLEELEEIDTRTIRQRRGKARRIG